MGHKQPKARAVPASAGRALPRTTAAPTTGIAQLKPLFSLEHADRNSNHAFHFDLDGEHAKLVLGFMCEMARLPWQEIWRLLYNSSRQTHRKHHYQALDTLCSDAQARITERRLDEVVGAELFRFRLAAKKRLWGFTLDNDPTFYVLWWDPDHKVYPMEPE